MSALIPMQVQPPPRGRRVPKAVWLLVVSIVVLLVVAVLVLNGSAAGAAGDCGGG